MGSASSLLTRSAVELLQRKQRAEDLFRRLQIAITSYPEFDTESFLGNVEMLYLLQLQDKDDEKRNNDGPAYKKWRLLECSKAIPAPATDAILAHLKTGGVGAMQR